MFRARNDKRKTTTKKENNLFLTHLLPWLKFTSLLNNINKVTWEPELQAYFHESMCLNWLTVTKDLFFTVLVTLFVKTLVFKHSALSCKPPMITPHGTHVYQVSAFHNLSSARLKWLRMGWKDTFMAPHWLRALSWGPPGHTTPASAEWETINVSITEVAQHTCQHNPKS